MRERTMERQGMKMGIQIPGCFCLHADSGRTKIPKLCIYGYECWHCAFDQWVWEMEERRSSTEGLNIQGDFLEQAA